MASWENGISVNTADIPLIFAGLGIPKTKILRPSAISTTTKIPEISLTNHISSPANSFFL
jgi:hypothetical protein